MIRINQDTTMTADLLAELIKEHKKNVNRRMRKLWKMYLSEHDILRERHKNDGKPDNRIVVNFPKYLVDTMNGYFLGNPVKVTAGGEDNEGVNDYLEFLNQYNDLDNVNSELGKLTDIFGNAYEIYYTDEEANLGVMYLSPLDAFMVYDESILARPIYFVRLYKGRDNIERGSISDAKEVRYFTVSGGVKFEDEPEEHHFGEVPATEFVANDERQGIFEPAITMIDEFNKALSEKANDVDYFADAVLKIIGAEVDEATMQDMRRNRTINVAGEDAVKVIVEFMEKPNADTTQENLIDRLERLIFQICMVANISDENFGTSSGIAMKYKLQGMSNLAKSKERKFTAALNRRYMLLFSNPASKVSEDAWKHLDYKFTPNIPANLAEEADTAAKLEGIVSKETQLTTLSIIENVTAEIERMDEEEQKALDNAVINRAFEGGADN